MPVLVDNKQLLMASPNPLDPNVEEELRLRFGMPVRTVLCTPANINDAIDKFVPGRRRCPNRAGGRRAGRRRSCRRGPGRAGQGPPTGPMTPEEKKQRRDYALVAFSTSMIVLVNAMYWGLGRGVFFSVMVALPLAAAAAGITWKVRSR